MAIIPADRHEFDKTLPLSRCSNSRQCNAWKATVSSHTCSPQLGPPGITQVSTGGWGAPSFSGVMNDFADLWSAWFGERLTCALDRTCPVIKVDSERSSSLILLWFFTLCSSSTILFQLPSTCWCVRVLLDFWSSDGCCQRWYWNCR